MLFCNISDKNSINMWPLSGEFIGWASSRLLNISSCLEESLYLNVKAHLSFKTPIIHVEQQKLRDPDRQARLSKVFVRRVSAVA